MMDVDEAFPFDEYRPYQRELLVETADALFDTRGIKNVIIDAPTGVGKSPVNIALGMMAEDAFYTTPQKGLRRQLEEDPDLKPYHSVVRARDDYTCNYPTGDVSCADCEVANDPNNGCYDKDCPYWDAKEAALDSQIATLTFSYLIVDKFLPRSTDIQEEDGTEWTLTVSFSDRNLLIVDEAHSLEEQVASLHAGFRLSGGRLSEIGNEYKDFISDYRRSVEYAESPVTTSDILLELRGLSTAVNTEVNEMTSSGAMDTEAYKQLRALQNKLEYCIDETEKGLPWVVSPDKPPAGEGEFPVSIQPVWVDSFLEEFVWSRASKRVLSTATMPYRDTPETWMKRLGLNPSETVVVSKPMPFPVEHRPVHTRSMIERFTSGRDRDDAVESRIVDTLNWIIKTHSGEKGLVHTVSYDRASRLYEFFEDNAILHQRSGPAQDEVIGRWQSSDADILFSPSMMEGVDLEGDMCRWQALAKVPYATLGDNRVSYLLYEEDDERWYNALAARQIVQAAGRGVRSPEDSCDFYVLDESFVDVQEKAAFPEWFEAAISD